MHNLQPEQDFFHFISREISQFVTDSIKHNAIAKHKEREGDFATHIDIGVEELIVKEINKRFPQDHILAEENHHDTIIPQERIWIIDPICGTANLSRNIKNFCTNIALAKNKQLIASCVIDHATHDSLWSIGGQKIYINDTLFESKDEQSHITLDIDFGSVLRIDKSQKEKHNRFLKKLITENDFLLMSLNTSLGFAYTAIHKMDGFITSNTNPWDICAAGFLIQQSTGIITDLEGKPWTIESSGVIAAKNKKIHEMLLTTYLTA